MRIYGIMAKYWNGTIYSTVPIEGISLYFSKELRDERMRELVREVDVIFMEFEIETEDEPCQK